MSKYVFWLCDQKIFEMIIYRRGGEQWAVNEGLRLPLTQVLNNFRLTTGFLFRKQNYRQNKYFIIFFI